MKLTQLLIKDNYIPLMLQVKNNILLKKLNLKFENFIPLIPHQRWFFDQNFEKMWQWNTVLELELSQPLNPEWMNKVVSQLMEHHNILRAKYIKINGQWLQNIPEKNNQIVTPYLYFDFTKLEQSEAEQKMNKIVSGNQNYENAVKNTLIKFVHFDLKDSTGKLFLIIHHVIFDGYSYFILLRDLQKLYRQIDEGGNFHLPEGTTSIQDWSYQLLNYTRSEKFKKEYDYWLQLPWHKIKPIPKDYNHLEKNTNGSARNKTVVIDQEKTELLIKQINHLFRANISDAVYTAILSTMTDWANSEHIALKVMNNGRVAIPESETDDYDLSHTIGPFAFGGILFLKNFSTKNPYVMIKDFLAQKKQIPNDGLGIEFLRYYGETENIRATARQLFQNSEVLINYVGNQTNRTKLFKDYKVYRFNTRHPDSKRGDVLEFTILLDDKKLVINMEYSENIHCEDTADQLIDNLKQNLLNMARALRSVKNKANWE